MHVILFSKNVWLIGKTSLSKAQQFFLGWPCSACVKICEYVLRFISIFMSWKLASAAASSQSESQPFERLNSSMELLKLVFPCTRHFLYFAFLVLYLCLQRPKRSPMFWTFQGSEAPCALKWFHICSHRFHLQYNSLLFQIWLLTQERNCCLSIQACMRTKMQSVINACLK